MKHSTPLFMPRSRFMGLMGIKARDTFRKRMREDPKFPRPVGRLFRVRDVLRYLQIDELPAQAVDRDVSDLV
jgi:hypothetical protein